MITRIPVFICICLFILLCNDSVIKACTCKVWGDFETYVDGSDVFFGKVLSINKSDKVLIYKDDVTTISTTSVLVEVEENFLGNTNNYILVESNKTVSETNPSFNCACGELKSIPEDVIVGGEYMFFTFRNSSTYLLSIKIEDKKVTKDYELINVKSNTEYSDLKSRLLKLIDLRDSGNYPIEPLTKSNPLTEFMNSNYYYNVTFIIGIEIIVFVSRTFYRIRRLQTHT